MASGVYKDGIKILMDNDVATLEPNLYLMLMQVGGAATFSDAVGKRVDDVVATDGNTEANFTGYTAFGARLSVGETEGAHTLASTVAAGPAYHLESDKDVIWDPAGNGDNDTIDAALLFYAVVAGTPVQANDIPIVLYDMSGAPKTTNSGSLTFNWGVEDSNKVLVKF